MRKNTQNEVRAAAVLTAEPPTVVQVVQVVRPERLQAPPPLHTPLPPADPPRPITDWARKVSQWPGVSITGHGRVLYGSKEHVDAVAEWEAREREARRLAPQIAADDIKTVEAESERLQRIAADAMAAALAVDDTDPRARYLREVWADRADSVRNCLEQLERLRERLDDARAYAKTEPAVTVAAVRQRRRELLDELGLQEADLVSPPGWRRVSPTGLNI
jgi:hypothetical protein